MKTVFKIGNEIGENDTLLLEVGPGHCCYAFFSESKNKLRGLRYLVFNGDDTEGELSAMLEPFRSFVPKKVLIGAAYPGSVLVPAKYKNAGYEFASFLYQLPQQKYLSDVIAEWQMNNVYSLPVGMYKILQNVFPTAQILHACTPDIKIYNGFTAADQLDVYFTMSNFRVLVKKGGQILLSQIYQYKTPLDVAYYLLKIAYELSLDQSSVLLLLSGLVDKDSALYKELHHYFLQVHFALPPKFTLPESEYPQHYFTSIYNLAACVS